MSPVRSRPVAATLAAACLAAALAAAGCGEHKVEPPPPTGPVLNGDTIRFPGKVDGIRTEPVRDAGSIALTLPGRLIWDEDRTVRVMAPFAGRVVKPMVGVGDTVRAGQPLAEMASAEFGSAVAEARQAENDLRLADDNLKRQRELFEAGIVSQKDLRAAEADQAGKRIERDRTQTRLRQIGASNGPNFTLRAPIAGVVVERNVNVGQEFRPDAGGQPLFVVTDPTRLWVRLDATESDLGRLAGVRPGTPLKIASAAYPEREFGGTLTHVGDAVDPESRTFRLRGAVPNPERVLKGEQYVSATFPLPAGESPRKLFDVPAASVMLVGNRRYVFVLDADGGFTRTEVQVVRETASRSIVAGLAEGQRVVHEGNLFLQQIRAEARVPAQLSGNPPPPAPATPTAATRP
jgi:cobalt-zinc-cadmium efflux system membrane fusion protein